MTTSLGDQIRKFAKSTDERVDLVIKKIVLDVGTSLVLKSPVGDPDFWKGSAPPGYVGGRFRANWQYGFNAVNELTTEETDKTGSISIGRIEKGTENKATGNVHYITNSLPYAERLENGHSQRQAPNGMVKITVLEFEPIVNAAVAELT